VGSNPTQSVEADALGSSLTDMKKNMEKIKHKITKILKKRLEEICLKTLGCLPTCEIFPGFKMDRDASYLTGKDRSLVKKEWDKYLKNLHIKRRVVKLDDVEKYCVVEGQYPDRLNSPEFITVGDPFGGCYAVLDIPNDVAIEIVGALKNLNKSIDTDQKI
jgi:hypothetical protein